MPPTKPQSAAKPKTAKTKAKAKPKSRKAQPEIIFARPTFDGFTFIAFGMYKGRRRHYWWHCGSCWEECMPSPERSDMDQEYGDHRWLCPGQVSCYLLRINRAAKQTSEDQPAAEPQQQAA